MSIFRIALVALVLPLSSPASATAETDPRRQTQAQVNATLRANAGIWDGLFWMALAHEIRTVCPTIDARMLRALSYANALYDDARALGYTRAQVKGFVEDRAETRRMRRLVEAYMAERGVDSAANVNGYCAQGRAEIAANSQAGQLIRAR